MNFAVFLMFAGASARHVLDGFNKQSDVQDGGYIDQGEPGDNVITNRFSQSVKNRSEVSNDSFNNISYENDYRLRTNAFTTEVYGTTERLHQGDVYSNVRSVKINDERQDQDQRKIYQGRKVYIGGTVQNKPIHHKPKTEPSVNQNTDRKVSETTPIYRIVNRFANNTEENIPVKTNVNKQNQNNRKVTNGCHSTEQTDKVIVKPIVNNEREPVDTVIAKPVLKNERVSPNSNDTEIRDDEQIWIWGTEKTKLSTDPGSLDDRAAFSGDKCPTGKAKVNGVCVEKD